MMTCCHEKPTNRRRGLGLICVVAPMLFACTTTEPYPQSWTPLPDEPPGDCNIADGYYANRPTDSRDGYRLSSQLSLARDVDFVRFTTDERGSVMLAAVRYGEVIAERALAGDASRVQCKAGWLLLDASAWVAHPIASGFQGKVVGLLFAHGYLVVKRRDSFAGWVYILPAFGRDDSWYRYEWMGELDLREMQEAALDRNKQANPYR